MKLATLKDGTRDGSLVIVSRDLSKYVAPTNIAKTLQYALDNWLSAYPLLDALYQELNEGLIADSQDFIQSQCESPLPRSYQWADGSAYVNHVELVRKARGSEVPASFWTDPLMYQGGSDAFIGPQDDIAVVSEEWGIDFEAEVAVITDDVPMGATLAQAEKSIRLVMLVNDVSLRGLIPEELGKGFGFFQSKPSSAFSPIALTPDELGQAWDGRKLSLPLLSSYNDKAFGCPNAGIDMTFEFPQLIAHAAKTRPLSSGAIIGSGTVSNKQDTQYGTSIEEGGVGYSCIAEVRMIETIRDGQPSTAFMKYGDTIKLEMYDNAGNNLFGTIEQKIVRYHHD